MNAAKKNYDWVIIGAGPAGIAAVGKLLDAGTSPQAIMWVDPQFKVGDFGSLWRNVPSNTKAGLFIKFFNEAKSFNYSDSPIPFAINNADTEKTCILSLPADVLQWITGHLTKVVDTLNDYAESVWLSERLWHIQLKSGEIIRSKKVILAMGAEAKQFSYPDLETIPLIDAMDDERIRTHLHPNDTIALFGSSHSAILALMNLTQNKVKRIINFYRSPLRYAVYLDSWILFDDSGLKGTTAQWAREHLDGIIPANLERVYSNEENIKHYLPQCNKVIYAIGFERRSRPIIKDMSHAHYIEECGIIAPGLFGLGIAFPQAKYNPFGILEYRVGLWKFMDYLKHILPVWQRYGT